MWFDANSAKQKITKREHFFSPKHNCGFIPKLARQKTVCRKITVSFHSSSRDKGPDCYLQKEEHFVILLQNETVFVDAENKVHFSRLRAYSEYSVSEYVKRDLKISDALTQ